MVWFSTAAAATAVQKPAAAAPPVPVEAVVVMPCSGKVRVFGDIVPPNVS